MRDHELDRLFDRFRRHGDVQALGAVFDATAPELLFVAMNLVRDPGEADDLLQETFLTAIERAGRYDAERRLVPWLLGILAHHAQERRRLRGRELDPTRLAERMVATPEAEARGRELEAELERALAELSARERSVLEAYLRHGKGAAEIASETGAAPGAVRMQIHRGLDRLRKVLPAGLALGGAVSAQGLVSVRSAVLRAGETAAKNLAPGAGSALGAGTAGVLMANKGIVAGAVAALVAGLFLLRSLGERGAGESEVARAESRAEAPVSSVATLVTPELPEKAAQSAQPQPSARVAAGPASDPDRAGLRGRVVEHDGTPVPGLAVGLLQVDESELLSAQFAAAQHPLQVTASARTGADGVFVLQDATVGALSALGIDLGGERATLRVLDADLAPGATADLGDVVLHLAGAVTGRVLDEDGNGVAGARVRVGPLPGIFTEFGLSHLTAGSALVELERSGAVDSVFELPAWLSAIEAKLPFATTTSGADGRFELARVAAGSLTALVDRAGYARLVSATVELEAGARVELGELVLARGAAVRGQVLDAAGRPVGGAEVRAGIVSRDREINVFTPIAECDAEGRFALEGLPSGWALAVIARRDALGAWVAGRQAADEFRVELPAQQELLIEVVDGTGAPVHAPELSLRCKNSMDEFGALAPPLVSCAAVSVDAAAGRWSLGRFGSGNYVVVARAAELAQASSAVVIGADAPPVTRLVLSSVRRVEVFVLDAATRLPLANALVRAEEEKGTPPVVLASTRTGSDGRAVLALPSSAAVAGVWPLWLRVEHARFAPGVRALDDSATQEVALSTGARLHARIVDPALARQRCMLMLQHRGSEQRREFHLPRLAVFSDEGTLELERLPAGTFGWSLHESLFAGEAMAFLDSEHEAEQFAQGQFTLEEGQAFELAIVTERAIVEAPPPTGAGASLSGVVRIDGRSAGALQVNLCPLDGPGETRFVEGLGGRFRFEDIAPGRYLLLVARDGSFEHAEGGHDFDDEVVIAPEEEHTVEYDLTLLRANVRVRDQEGRPVQGAIVGLEPRERDSFVTREVTTDASGEASFSVTRAGPYRVTAAHPEHGMGEVELALGNGESGTATITLLAGVECSGRVVFEPGAAIEDGPTQLVVMKTGATRSQLVCPLEVIGGTAAFRLAGLQPGTYEAWLTLGPRSFHTRFELSEFGSATLELRFTERALHPHD